MQPASGVPAGCPRASVVVNVYRRRIGNKRKNTCPSAAAKNNKYLVCYTIFVFYFYNLCLNLLGIKKKTYGNASVAVRNASVSALVIHHGGAKALLLCYLESLMKLSGTEKETGSRTCSISVLCLRRGLFSLHSDHTATAVGRLPVYYCLRYYYYSTFAPEIVSHDRLRPFSRFIWFIRHNALCATWGLRFYRIPWSAFFRSILCRINFLSYLFRYSFARYVVCHYQLVGRRVSYIPWWGQHTYLYRFIFVRVRYLIKFTLPYN